VQILIDLHGIGAASLVQQLVHQRHTQHTLAAILKRLAGTSIGHRVALKRQHTRYHLQVVFDTVMYFLQKYLFLSKRCGEPLFSVPASGDCVV